MLRRELSDIRESATSEKRVSLSVGEKHKRELEQLLKEIDQLKRENKRTREDAKQKGETLFVSHKKGAAIAQCLPSCRPGFESQAYHLSFHKFIVVSCGKDENKRKRGRDFLRQCCGGSVCRAVASKIKVLWFASSFGKKF